MQTVFPGSCWERCGPEQASLDPDKLDNAKTWLDEHLAGKSCRCVIVRGGRVVAEWNQGTDPGTLYSIASAAKSIYSNLLGILVREGNPPSADAHVVDYYPEMMEVPEGEGPKEGRYAFEKDCAITFRQLISNTSGYMKPGEMPGEVFHYQTYGMNILTHALAKIHGLYDAEDPEGSPGFGELIRKKLAEPIGARWQYSYTNFQLHSRAKLGIFGYYSQVRTTALDLARIGWLWCNGGWWDGVSVVPEAWLDESVSVAPNIRQHCPEEEWQYGLGFWTNQAGQLWPDLPTTGFTASGAGGHYISVFPDQSLVIVQNPGPYARDPSGSTARGNPEFRARSLAATRDV